MENYTYSFADVSVVIAHPAVGQCIAQGQGLGDITVSYANDLSAHLLSNDGTVTTSKIEAPNGTVTINTTQVGEIHRFLTKLANYCKVASASEWARTSILIRGNGFERYCTGVSPQKIPDETLGQQAQNVAWALLAAKITSEPI